MTESTPENGDATWVTKRDRHVQLINSNIYDKEIQTRNKAIDKTLRRKALEKQKLEKEKINRHLRSFKKNTGGPSQVSVTSTSQEVNIDGLRFIVMNDGSKLRRIRGNTWKMSTFVFMLIMSRLI